MEITQKDLKRCGEALTAMMDQADHKGLEAVYDLCDKVLTDKNYTLVIGKDTNGAEFEIHFPQQLVKRAKQAEEKYGNVVYDALLCFAYAVTKWCGNEKAVAPTFSRHLGRVGSGYVAKEYKTASYHPQCRFKNGVYIVIEKQRRNGAYHFMINFSDRQGEIRFMSEEI